MPMRPFQQWLAALALALSACGGGGGGGADPAPTISNLRIAPASAVQRPGGSATITGTIDFSDSGGNVARLRLVGSAGADLTVPVPLPGVKAGTLSGTFDVSVDQRGHFTFEVWLEDEAGQASNRLGGSFDVLVDGSAGTWRDITAGGSLAAALQGLAVHDSVQAGGRTLAVGQQGLVIDSADLATWTRRSTPVTHHLHSVASSGAAFVAVGDNGQGDAVVLRSTDGAAWTVQQRLGGCPDGAEPPVTCTAPARLGTVIWTGAQFVAVGRETHYGDGAGDHALVLTSPDGLAWTQRAAGAVPVGSGESVGVGGVAWSGSLLVMAGQASDGSAGLWTSPDALTWTPRSVPLPGQRVLRDVAWGLGRFVAVGWGGQPATVTSTDGITWQANEDAAPLVAANWVVPGHDRFLAGGPVYQQTTPDGRLWTPVQMQGCAAKPLWDGARWVAVGSRVCVSP